MKKLKTLALTGALVLGSLAAWARVVYNRTLVSETALAYNNTYTLDMGSSILTHSNIDALSMQAVYSSSTIAAITFTDGNTSTGTITISTAGYSNLVGNVSTNTLTVKSTATIVSKSVYFTLNGIQFVYGDLWSVGTTSATTSLNICNAITGYGPTAALYTCSTTTIYGAAAIATISSNTANNSFTLTTSSQAALTASGATFAGGKNHAFIVINGTTLTEGTDFNAVTNASTTAQSISNAIQNNSTLSAIIGSTWTVNSSSQGIVSATSTAIGANTQYGWFSSDSADAKCSNLRLFGGSDSAVGVAADTITKTNHGFSTALGVLLTKSAGTVPTGLSNNTTYYVIKTDANNFKLATTSTGAVAGSKIDITAITGGGTFTLTPLNTAGTPSFKWQGSNDNSNWNDVSVSSVTMSSLAPASTTWDFGSVNYRYIRLNVISPTAGGISLVVTGIGKSSN